MAILVIRRTFVILPSVGSGREAALWRSGILDWSDFMSADKVPGISAARKSVMDSRLEQADRFLSSGRTDIFTAMLPTVEHWRLFQRFRDDVAYLDIETDGCHSSSKVTVVGVMRGGEMTHLVQGRDLSGESVSQALDGAKLLVTFNGSSFDLPMLERSYPMSVPRVPHYDLRHACRRAGWTGGLKSIERQMGIGRAREVEYVTGEEAVYLWKAYQRTGRANPLRILLQYNEEDVRNMEPIAHRTYDVLRGMLERRAAS